MMDYESEILEEIAGLNIAKETVFKLKKENSLLSEHLGNLNTYYILHN